MIAKLEIENDHPCSEDCGRSNLRPLFEGGEINHFAGKTKPYSIEIYNSGKRNGFTGMPEYSGLIDVATNLYLNIYSTRDRELSIDRMKRGLSHPRTILMLALHQGTPVGFGLFPRLLISGEPVIYSSRGFEPKHEGEGLGTQVLDKAIQLHQKESYRSIRFGVLMTQNAFSVVTLYKLKERGLIEKILPFDERYDQDPEQEAQRIMLGVHREVYMKSLVLIPPTGVSRGELKELGMNEAIYRRPRQGYEEASRIHETMVSSPSMKIPNGLGMNREDGDVVYVTFKLKRSNGASTGIPSNQTA